VPAAVVTVDVEAVAVPEVSLEGGGGGVGLLLLLPLALRAAGVGPRPISASCADRERVSTESDELWVTWCCCRGAVEVVLSAAAPLLLGLAAVPANAEDAKAAKKGSLGREIVTSKSTNRDVTIHARLQTC
jgi:hypothetical protein